MKTLGHVRDGKADGPFAAWHENGQMSEQGIYKAGKKEGLWILWGEDGKEVSRKKCKDDEEVAE